ncbi:MAG: DUF3182 family protein [Casimicrobiaceae bacterium]
MIAKTSVGTVVTTAPSMHHDAPDHESATRRKIAATLADLKGFEFAGEFDPVQRYVLPLYFVPATTLVGVDHAARLGIRGEDDLFGGVVPFGLMATKSITHPLLDSSRTPEGWSADFAGSVAGHVLDGYTAFDRGDARRAGLLMLEKGPLRIKRSRGVGGNGQWVVTDAHAMQARLAGIDSSEIETSGVVLEENLEEVTTYSVGQIRVDGMLVSYWGTQRLTRNNHGAEVYGGSDLTTLRGDFAALAGTTANPEVRLAISSARVYDAAASECFIGFFASRRNYDVVSGTDAHGRRRVGVLEQSWRIGGASGAEMAALAMFRRDRGLVAARASTVEVYGAEFVPPARATVLFHGVDPRIGPLTKYVVSAPHVHA